MASKATTKENRILRFDFSGDEPVMLAKPTPKKTISPEQRAAMNEGIKTTSQEVLTPREKRFCELYVELGNGSQAVMQAGYNTANPTSASVYANGLLKQDKVQKEISRLQKLTEDATIADAKEVMQFFTDVMRGKVKDQFGLEASLAERSKAAQEIAKRTVDIDNKIRANQPADNVVTIKLDWKQD